MDELFDKVSFRRRLGRWLEKFHFSDDPFAVYEADQERPYLHNFYVDRPYLHDVIGDPKRPQTAVLMAGRGGGKTATRSMINYECAYADLRRRALPVQYFDFTPLLEEVNYNLEDITVTHHVRMILRAILKASAEEVPPTYYDLLPDPERQLMMGYVSAFADPLSQIKLKAILNCDPILLEWQAFSPLEILSHLSNIVVQLGQSDYKKYESIYILVDRVDETAAGPETAVALLAPLLREKTLLNMPHLAFKFFLAKEVGQQLQQIITLPQDRLCVRTITWNKEKLQEVVEQRIAYYSGGAYTRLSELCSTGAKGTAVDRLIKASDNSPRILLRLCQSLIYHHIQHTHNALITHEDITTTLTDFFHQQNIETTTSISKPIQTEIVDAIPENELYLDDSHVWLNSERLPALSPSEFRLLKTLYKNEPNVVSHEALIESVWQTEEPALHDDKQSAIQGKDDLRKLISRLRNRLPGKGEAYIKNARGRGYWLQKSPK